MTQQTEYPAIGTVIEHAGRELTYLGEPYFHQCRDGHLTELVHWAVACKRCDGRFTVKTTLPLNPNQKIRGHCEACIPAGLPPQSRFKRWWDTLTPAQQAEQRGKRKAAAKAYHKGMDASQKTIHQKNILQGMADWKARLTPERRAEIRLAQQEGIKRYHAERRAAKAVQQ